jgi:aminoglycoside phosphotransferase (APT) family kinase protein
MTQMPSEQTLRWAADAMGAGATVVSVEALHDNPGPWWLHVEHDGTVDQVVLRAGARIPAPEVATEAAALLVAEKHGVSAPRLLACDPEGRVTGTPASVVTALPGSSALPPKVTPERLREAGAAIAKVHAVRLQPRPDLPLRIRPTEVVDRALEGRWATVYQACAETEKSAVIDALCELTGWTAERARHVVGGPRSTALLQLADERIRQLGRPEGETVLVHGDIWGGNMRWNGDTCLGLIDWRCAGAGDPGVDIGELRMQMAHQYGIDTAIYVLDGWERESGREATNVAYWDVVAALNTPADMAGWPGFDDHGKPAEHDAVAQRRDTFLRAALDKL